MILTSYFTSWEIDVYYQRSLCHCHNSSLSLVFTINHQLPRTKPINYDCYHKNSSTLNFRANFHLGLESLLRDFWSIWTWMWLFNMAKQPFPPLARSLINPVKLRKAWIPFEVQWTVYRSEWRQRKSYIPLHLIAFIIVIGIHSVNI